MTSAMTPMSFLLLQAFILVCHVNRVHPGNSERARAVVVPGAAELHMWTNFLLEVWESLYHLFLSLFLTEKAPSDFLEYAKNWVASSPPSADEASTRRNLDEMLQDLSEKNNYQADFAKYLSEEVSKDATANFWSQFVFQDCYAYVALFLAIRSGNWDLRMAAIKSMAPLFAAFDRVKYQKLIAMHIVDMLSLPTDTLSHLQSGGFTVSIKGRPCHSIGIDEAHEMCVNKDSKEYATGVSTRTKIINFN